MHPHVMHHPRDVLTLHMARVAKVRRGERIGGGGSAEQWVADLLLLPGGVSWPGVMVLGNRTPVKDTPSRPAFALCGAFGANMSDPWCLPIPWMSAPPTLLAGSELLDEYDGASVRLSTAGVYTIAGRGDEGGPWLTLSNAMALLREGTRRLARGGDAETAGDMVAINATTSPALAAWIANVGEILNLLLIFTAGLGMPPVVIPPAPATLPPTPGGALIRPSDPVPATGDQPAQVAAGVQGVGEIRTGSATVKGE